MRTPPKGAQQPPAHFSVHVFSATAELLFSLMRRNSISQELRVRRFAFIGRDLMKSILKASNA